METEFPGIFAAGDIRSGSPKQVVTAVGDGATAAIAAQRFLQQIK
jgi:thioredoxin reductase (NADPH)